MEVQSFWGEAEMVAQAERKNGRAPRLRPLEAFDPEELYLNRELSWVSFNERVVEHAQRRGGSVAQPEAEVGRGRQPVAVPDVGHGDHVGVLVVQESDVGHEPRVEDRVHDRAVVDPALRAPAHRRPASRFQSSPRAYSS